MDLLLIHVNPQLKYLASTWLVAEHISCRLPGFRSQCCLYKFRQTAYFPFFFCNMEMLIVPISCSLPCGLSELTFAKILTVA